MAFVPSQKFFLRFFFQLVPQDLFVPLQAMVIIAWSPSGSLSSIFEADVFRNVLTIFITAAFLNFLQGTDLLCDSRDFLHVITLIVNSYTAYFKHVFLNLDSIWSFNTI